MFDFASTGWPLCAQAKQPDAYLIAYAQKPATKKAVDLHYALVNGGTITCIKCKTPCKSQTQYEVHNGCEPMKSFLRRRVELHDLDAFFSNATFNLGAIDDIWPPMCECRVIGCTTWVFAGSMLIG